ncbi:hypothetical protein [Paenibacillus arenosi]|uniref:Uncharacterized protein n=1 Tax=Paenibacillus arenosi TaxID=2774142 RepID=A0ABR9B5X6_9BACL|nr:hypothetical protein [Paenibacillus arenosi]MBD8500870.1 hypothetical protein [Paenibacillus arenosi]
MLKGIRSSVVTNSAMQKVLIYLSMACIVINVIGYIAALFIFSNFHYLYWSVGIGYIGFMGAFLCKNNKLALVNVVLCIGFIFVVFSPIMYWLS